MSKEYKITVEKIIAKTNIYGSGISLGHPLGCTGARLTTTLAHTIKNNKFNYGIASTCIGGGMGISLLLKGVN